MRRGRSSPSRPSVGVELSSAQRYVFDVPCILRLLLIPCAERPALLCSPSPANATGVYRAHHRGELVVCPALRTRYSLPHPSRIPPASILVDRLWSSPRTPPATDSGCIPSIASAAPTPPPPRPSNPPPVRSRPWLLPPRRSPIGDRPTDRPTPVVLPRHRPSLPPCLWPPSYPRPQLRCQR